MFELITNFDLSFIYRLISSEWLIQLLLIVRPYTRM